MFSLLPIFFPFFLFSLRIIFTPMSGTSSGGAHATSTDRDHQRDHERQRQSSRQETREHVVSPEMRMQQRRAQLIRYVLGVNEVVLTREHLLELLDEFPDAMAMVLEMDEERQAYDTNEIDEVRDPVAGTDDAGAVEDALKAERQQASAQPQWGFIRNHWPKILLVLAVGGLGLVAWFWGPTLWASLKLFLLSPEGEAALRYIAEKAIISVIFMVIKKEWASLVDPIAKYASGKVVGLLLPYVKSIATGHTI